MSLNSRQQQILSLLEGADSVSILELADRFQVSDETIRRDLKALAEGGLVEKFHGGVRRTEPRAEAPFERRLKEMTDAKRRIAAMTAELISDGATILLDNSSTSCFLAHALVHRENLTAITFSVEVAQILTFSGRRHRVILPGGELRADDRTIIGPSAIEFASQFTPDFFVMSVAAASAQRGCMDFDLFETQFKRAMMGLAGQVLVMIDSSKFVKSGLIHVCDWKAVDILVSDDVPASVLEQMEDRQVHIAAPGPRSRSTMALENG
jgi:DeoR family glycerol-3-phosphate regulon repressor